MSQLSNELNNLKEMYREIFLKSAEELNLKICELKPKIDCTRCNKCSCEIDITNNFPSFCEYKDWQKNTLTFFDKEVLPDIHQKMLKINAYQKLSQCSSCGACCKLATSEFSYEELREKAKNGDNFATQFTSVFIPYEDESVAQKIYPDYFALIKEKYSKEKIYFYHCPKVTEDNRCSDYENRPQICRDFPDNPLSLLPPFCGFSSWKKEVEPTALMLYSMLEIIDFYKCKIASA